MFSEELIDDITKRTLKEVNEGRIEPVSEEQVRQDVVETAAAVNEWYG